MYRSKKFFYNYFVAILITLWFCPKLETKQYLYAVSATK